MTASADARDYVWVEANDRIRCCASRHSADHARQSPSDHAPRIRTVSEEEPAAAPSQRLPRYGSKRYGEGNIHGLASPPRNFAALAHAGRAKA
jgi:hypothetical protein